MIGSVINYERPSVRVKTVKRRFYQKRIPSFIEKYRVSDGKAVIKLYREGGETLIYRSDKKVYRVEDSGLSEICPIEFDCAPSVTQIAVAGEKRFLLTDETKSAISGEAYNISGAERGDCRVFINGRIATAKGEEIRFTERLSASDFSSRIKTDGYYRTDIRGGAVVYTCELKERLCVLCENSVIFIDSRGDFCDFSAEKLDCAYLKIKEKSAVKIGEEVYFITDGKLGVLKNEVKTYDLPVDLKSVEIKNAATALGYYLLHLKKNGKGVLLCVKKRTDGSLFTFLKDFDGELENEGYFYDQTENAVFALTETADGENYIADDDLEKCGLKTLTEINFHCRADGSLKITGDFGEKIFSVKKDCNIIKCRLRSKVFSFYSDAAPAEITAKYLFNGGL